SETAGAFGVPPGADSFFSSFSSGFFSSFSSSKTSAALAGWAFFSCSWAEGYPGHRPNAMAISKSAVGAGIALARRNPPRPPFARGGWPASAPPWEGGVRGGGGREGVGGGRGCVPAALLLAIEDLLRAGLPRLLGGLEDLLLHADDFRDLVHDVDE